MGSPEALYRQVKSGKVKLEDLNDKGKAALKSYMDNKKAAEKYGTNEQRAGSAVVRQRAEENQAARNTHGTNEQRLGSAMARQEAERKQKELSSQTPYEKWYEKNVSNSFVGKALDKLQGADRSVSNFKAGALDTASLGATQGLGRAAINNLPGGKENLSPILKDRLDSGAYTAGKFAGYIAPGVAADRLVVKLGGQALNKLKPVAQGLVRGSTSGALDMAAQEVGDVAFRQGQFDPMNVALGAGLGGALGGAIPVIAPWAKKAYDAFRSRGRSVAPEVEQNIAELLALPAPRARGNVNKAQTPEVIYGSGKVKEYEPLGLPSGDPVQRTKYTVAGNNQALNKVMNEIKPEVESIITPPARRDLLIDYIQRNLGIPKNEIWNMPMKDLQELGVAIRQEMDIPKIAFEVAGKRGYDLAGLLEGKAPSVGQRVSQDAQRRTYGVYPDELPNIRMPQFTRQTTGNLASPVERVGRAPINQDVIMRSSRELPKALKDNLGSNPFINSSPGREPKPIKLDEKVIEFNESGIGNADSFGSKISNEATKKKGSLSRWWEKTRTQLIDDLAPLEGLEKRVTGSVASAESSLYKSGRMFKGVPERAAQVVQQKLAPIVKGIEDIGKSSDDLGKYALAVHAKDVNNAGLKSGFTNAEIEDTIQRFGSPEMEAARLELIKVNKEMLQELVDNQVVSRELAEALNERWKNYIPLFRAFDEESVEFGSGLSDALANVASPIKALKGSERKVINPLENMVKNVFQSIQAAERNKVASQLHRLAENDIDGKYVRKLADGEEVGKKNVVNVKVNGNNVRYEVEPDVYKSLLSLDKESAGMIINILSKPASLLRSGATLTPEFSLRNPMRDVVQAFVVSKSGFNPITDFGAGLIQTISKGKLYQDWIDNLGAYGNIMSMDRDVHKKALEKVLGENIGNKFVNIISGKSLLRALRYITDTTESATKVGEYRAALRKGVTKEEAAYRSRDIMDFARAGSGIRQTNRIIAFLNANIQGKSKLIRSIKENPAGTIARAGAAVTVPTVGIFMLNKEFANETQQETIKNAPDWMRNSFWLMAIPGTDVVARIPKPFDLATIFANLPEKALEYTFDNDREAFDNFTQRALKESALPTQISALLPIIEGMSGYSFFRESDIVPQREQGLKKEDQYDPTRTSEVAKVLAKGADAITGGKGAFKNFSSPRIVDNTIQGLTAGLGKYATDAVDSVLMGKIPFTGVEVTEPLIDRPKAPEKALEQQPLLRSFLVDPNQSGKEENKFYNNRRELSEEKASNKLNDVAFGNDGKKDINLPFKKNQALNVLDDANDDVSAINKHIREIEKDTLMSPSLKRLRIDKLVNERKEIIKKANKLSESGVK